MSNRRKSTPAPRDPATEWKAFVKSVGATLSAERKARGLTQQQVAELLQVEPETISRIESGAIVPTLQRLRQFAAVYECPMASLVGRTSDLATDIAKRLGARLSELSPTDRVFVAEQAEALISHLSGVARRRG
jgi:transcriptional regulator with XRE-family HTH domain